MREKAALLCDLQALHETCRSTKCAEVTDIQPSLRYNEAGVCMIYVVQCIFVYLANLQLFSHVES